MEQHVCLFLEPLFTDSVDKVTAQATNRPIRVSIAKTPKMTPSDSLVQIIHSLQTSQTDMVNAITNNADKLVRWFGGIIVFLMGVIAFFLKREMDKIDKKFTSIEKSLEKLNDNLVSMTGAIGKLQGQIGEHGKKN